MRFKVIATWSGLAAACSPLSLLLDAASPSPPCCSACFFFSSCAAFRASLAACAQERHRKKRGVYAKAAQRLGWASRRGELSRAERAAR